ncbi:iron ABC transporter permease [Paenibacillus sp. S150]|uniref:FecCD family ABC transporter permease n=1 Tax=Paenibacillus sp. S150 TaxID=2749826 RepID=UPI001C5763B8|nr:iron ABC transporter permease [Paenibacillus sp. S150]MBW4084167.1 iron ABC transporter permease [Paenibacillus sp. S150]
MKPGLLASSGQRWQPIAYFAVGFALLVLLFHVSLMVGPAFFSVSMVWNYLFHYSGTAKEELILHILRMPRALATLMIGANLAVAGCIMQALTRNPLASPSVFGINSGASFMVVLGAVLFPGIGGLLLAGASFAGGVLTVLLVLIISASVRGGRIEVRMALIGVVIQAVLSSFTQGLLIFNEESAGRILFWLAGSVAGIKWAEIGLLALFSLTGMIASIWISHSLSLISLGDEVACSLGQRIWLLRLGGSGIVIILAGISVSVCGPIGFVGLIVPHISRYLIGRDYRLLIPFSAVLGGILLTAADIVSRFISFPSETPVGIVTALIGAPYFVFLARRRSRGVS